MQEVETVVKVCLVAQAIVEKALANLLIAAHVLMLPILPALYVDWTLEKPTMLCKPM